MAQSQQSKISFSLLCWTKLFSTRTLSRQENEIQMKRTFGFIPLCPFLSCLGFISAVSCEACALVHPGTPLSQAPPGADCFQAACGSTCGDQTYEWKTHCPSVTQRNCFHHLELCLSNLFDSLSLLPSYPPRWLLFKASFVFICTNPKADLALTSHKLTCWVF